MRLPLVSLPYVLYIGQPYRVFMYSAWISKDTEGAEQNSEKVTHKMAEYLCTADGSKEDAESIEHKDSENYMKS